MHKLAPTFSIYEVHVINASLSFIAMPKKTMNSGQQQDMGLWEWEECKRKRLAKKGEPTLPLSIATQSLHGIS